MTVTRDQAQMLTTLAIACRPHRAPTWDAAGVMAAIGRVKERSLPEVVLAVIRAAADREVESPGVIPSNGSHWQEQLKPSLWQPKRGPWCSTCGQPRPEAGGKCVGHEWEPPADRKRSPDAMAAIVEDAKQRKAPTTTASEPERHEPDPRAHAAREVLHHNESEASA